MSEDKRRFWIATEEEIRSGRVADVYFDNTVRVLEAAGRDPLVVAEVRARRLPKDGAFGVLCGMDEVVALMDGVRGVDLVGLPDGSVFAPEEPVLTLEGRYRAFARHETAILGLLCQASGIATAAARCRAAAGGRGLLSFGARRQHPALAPLIERAAYVGGADSVSSVIGAELLGRRASGTMPHSLMLVIGDTVEAARLFDAAVDRETARIVLVDTFRDEADEAVRVARALGGKLQGVRLDTPASRRGDMATIVRDVRWELDLRGFAAVKIVASGGLGENEIRALRDIVDSFGVGSAISRAPEIDFAMDIVEVDGEARAKRAKRAGRKELWRCPMTGERKVLPAGVSWERPAGFPAPERLLAPLIHDGVPVAPPQDAESARTRAKAFPSPF